MDVDMELLHNSDGKATNEENIEIKDKSTEHKKEGNQSVKDVPKEEKNEQKLHNDTYEYQEGIEGDKKDETVQVVEGGKMEVMSEPVPLLIR